MLTSTFPARPGDGTPEFVLSLARKLSEHDEVTVVAPRRKNASNRIGDINVRHFAYFPRRFERLGEDAIMPQLRSHPLLLVQAVAFVVSYCLATARAVRRVQPDVVHAHWLIPGGLAAAVAKLIAGVPYVVTAHGADAFTLEHGVFRAIKNWIARGATAIVPVSAGIAQRLGITTQSVMPIGVDADDVRSGVGDRSPERGHCVFIGRLARKKGADLAIRAMAALPDFRLSIVGDGPEYHALSALARDLHVDDRVVFHGRQPRHVVYDFLRVADAVLIPSVVAPDGDQDGTPVVLMEAVAAQVPVIASRIAGIVDVVDDRSALLYPPGSVDDLARAIRESVGSPAASATRAKRAFDSALAMIDLNRVAEEYRRIYRAEGRG